MCRCHMAMATRRFYAVFPVGACASSVDTHSHGEFTAFAFSQQAVSATHFRVSSSCNGTGVTVPRLLAGSSFVRS